MSLETDYKDGNGFLLFFNFHLWAIRLEGGLTQLDLALIVPGPDRDRPLNDVNHKGGEKKAATQDRRGE